MPHVPRVILLQLLPYDAGGAEQRRVKSLNERRCLKFPVLWNLLVAEMIEGKNNNNNAKRDSLLPTHRLYQMAVESIERQC